MSTNSERLPKTSRKRGTSFGPSTMPGGTEKLYVGLEERDSERGGIGYRPFWASPGAKERGG